MSTDEFQIFKLLLFLYMDIAGLNNNLESHRREPLTGQHQAVGTVGQPDAEFPVDRRPVQSCCFRINTDPIARRIQTCIITVAALYQVDAGKSYCHRTGASGDKGIFTVLIRRYPPSLESYLSHIAIIHAV